MAYETKIILDSASPAGGRLTTFQFTLPRIVLAEFNTHRMLSRNSASSRAIPVEKMIRRVMDDPFVPTYFGKNQKGMQAETELEEVERVNAKNAWMEASRSSIKYAQIFKDLGLHKQLANRILETFNWHTIVCSATEYATTLVFATIRRRRPRYAIVRMKRRSSTRRTSRVSWETATCTFRTSRARSTTDRSFLLRVTRPRSFAKYPSVAVQPSPI